MPSLARAGSATERQAFGNSLLAASSKQEFLRKYRQMHAKHANSIRLNEPSRLVIGGAFTVLNTLGAGFLEKVYENALAHELRKAGLVVAQQCGAIVTDDSIVVGEYFVDLLVEDAVLVEWKTVKELVDAHRLQCIKYLKATDRHLCLLLNFGHSCLEIKRVVSRL